MNANMASNIMSQGPALQPSDSGLAPIDQHQHQQLWKHEPTPLIQFNANQDFTFDPQTRTNLGPNPDTSAMGGYEPFDPDTISAMDLWNRLQSFYEPTPAFWGMGEVGMSAAMSQGGAGLGEGFGGAGWM
jgi:hypothetical protein